MKVRVSEAAERDIAESFTYYESQRVGLGHDFVDVVRSKIDELEVNGGIHAKYFGKHRCLCNRFPHAIFYDIDDEAVTVVAVLHTRTGDQRRDRRLH